MLKVCTLCNTKKTEDNFSFKNKAKDGLNPWCKECTKKKDHSYYLGNTNKIKKRNRIYTASRLEKYREYYYTAYHGNLTDSRKKSRKKHFINKYGTLGNILHKFQELKKL